MTYYLSQLIRDTLDVNGLLTVITATGGTTTTVVDANANGAYGDDDDALKNGTAFVIRDNGGASAAPENEMQRISTFDGTTITVDTAFTAAPAAGDTIGIGSPIVPMVQCIQLANRALQSLGTIPVIDTTTIVPVANTTEYTWPVAWKFAPPYRIDVQGYTNITGINDWREITSQFEIQPAAPGSTGKIIFHGQLPLNHDVRVHYLGLHPTVNAYNDPVQESIHPNLAQAALTYYMARWNWQNKKGNDKFSSDWYQDAQNALIKARQDYKVWSPTPKPITFVIGNLKGRGVDTFTTPPAA